MGYIWFGIVIITLGAAYIIGLEDGLAHAVWMRKMDKLEND